MKTSIHFLDYISALDWTIFFVILLITLFSVLYGQSLKKKDTEKESFLDLLIMGRQLSLPLFIGTLVATWYGGIFGVTKIAFEQGVFNLVTQGFFWYLSYFIFALFIVNKIEPYKALTLPDLLGKMFGPKSAKIGAVFNFFNVLPIAYTISLGLFTQLIFGGELWLNMLIGVCVVLLYSVYGGLRAVVFSDLIQFFVMCIGVFLIIVFSFNQFGGLGFLKDTLPPSYFSLTGKSGWGQTLIWGFIALSTLVDPNFYQRCFAAKSKKVAKKGILFSILIWFCFDICTTFGAMYAKAVIPEADSAQAYLIYSMQILPDGLRGLFLAGIMATILSTLDSYLFLAGTTVSYDLVSKRFQGKPYLHHIGVCSVGLLSILMALYFEDIKAVWKTLGSYSAACLLFPVTMGYVFPKKIGDKLFCTSCICSVLGVTYWRNADYTGFLAEVDELYIGLLISFLVLGPKLIKKPN